MQFSMMELEHVVSGETVFDVIREDDKYAAAEGRIYYKPIERVAPLNVKTTCLVGIGEQAEAARSLWVQTMSSGALIGSGILFLRDFLYFGDASLPFDPRSRSVLIGSPLNWSESFASWYIPRQLAAGAPVIWDAASRTGDLQFGDEAVVDIDEDCILLSSPGQDIFGHWLLDYVPRLYLLEKSGLLQTSGRPQPTIFLNTVPEWAGPILALFGIDRAQVRALPPLARLRNAAIPTATKAGYRLAHATMAAAWRLFTDRLLPEIAGPRDRKVFFSRRRWTDQRRDLPTRDAIEQLAQSRGYEVLYPEDYALAEQAKIVNSARVIVGEDGSALHNIVFSRAPITLGVICNPERVNLWHMGICDALNHSILYCGPRKENVAEMLDKIESVI